MIEEKIPRTIDIYIVDLSLSQSDPIYNNNEAIKKRLIPIANKLKNLAKDKNKKIYLATGRSQSTDGKDLPEIYTGLEVFASDEADDNFLSSVQIIKSRGIAQVIKLAQQPSTRKLYYYAAPPIYARHHEGFEKQIKDSNLTNIDFAPYDEFLKDEESEKLPAIKTKSELPSVPSAISAQPTSVVPSLSVIKNKTAAAICFFVSFFILSTLALVLFAPALPVISDIAGNSGALLGLFLGGGVVTGVGARQMQLVNNAGGRSSKWLTGFGVLLAAAAIATLAFLSAGAILLIASGFYLLWQSGRAAKHNCCSIQTVPAELSPSVLSSHPVLQQQSQQVITNQPQTTQSANNTVLDHPTEPPKLT